MQVLGSDASSSDRAFKLYDEVVTQVGMRMLLSANRPESHYSLRSKVDERRREREQLAGKTILRLPRCACKTCSCPTIAAARKPTREHLGFPAHEAHP